MKTFINRITVCMATILFISASTLSGQVSEHTYSDSFWFQRQMDSGSSLSFTITQPMTITIHNYEHLGLISILSDNSYGTTITVRNTETGVVVGEQNRSLYRNYVYDAERACLTLDSLPAGTYTVTCTGFDSIPVTVQGYPSSGAFSHAGEDRSMAIDLGTFGYDDFAYSHMRNTDDDRYHSSYGTERNDVFYKFTLTSDMYVVINHWGSPVASYNVPTAIYLLEYDPTVNTFTEITGNGAETGPLQVPYDHLPEIENYSPFAALWHGNLSSGTYYVVSETPYYGGNMGYVYEGMLLTNIRGFAYPRLSSRSTINAGNSTNGRLTFSDSKYYDSTRNDIIKYTFTLDKEANIDISTNASNIVLKKGNTTIASSGITQGSTWEKTGLSSGTYTLEVSSSQSAILTTQISTERYYKPDRDYMIGEVDGNFSFRDIAVLDAPSDTTFDFKFRIKSKCSMLFDYTGTTASLSVSLKDSTTNNILFDKSITPDYDKFVIELCPGSYYHDITGIGSLGMTACLGIRVHDTKDESAGIGQPFPTSDKAYIAVYRPMSENISTPAVSNSNLSIEYYDGLGRPIQAVRCGESPYGDDLVTTTEYEYGRPVTQWNETPISSKGQFSSVQVVSKASASAYEGDSKAYSSTTYESSLLDRISSVTGPGQIWHETDGGKPVRTEYLINEADGATSCLNFSISGNYDAIVLPTVEGSYPSGVLSVIKTTDEDGKITYTFKNNDGQTIMSRCVLESDSFSDTYYVYDKRTLLRAIIPPAAAGVVATSGVLSSANFANHCYGFGYDDMGRCSIKHIPGQQGNSKTIWTPEGHPIFTQNPNQAQTGVWSFDIPDEFGRTALIGETDSAESELEIFAGNNPCASPDISMGEWKYYDIYGGFLNITTIHQAFYYDSYQFLASHNASGKLSCLSAHIPGTVRTATSTPSTKGLLTGVLSYEAESGTQILSALYYDRYGNLVQTRSENILGGVSTYVTHHDFQGNVTLEREIHTTSSGRTDDLSHSYEYDRAGRLFMTITEVNGSAPVVTFNSYDDIGRKERSVILSGNTADSTIFSYNARGWYTRTLNNSYSSRLRYSNPVLTSSVPQYSGNITEWEWSRNGDTYSNRYAFHYDPLDRLISSTLYRNTSTYDRYSEKNITYDLGGNIRQISRRNGTATEACLMQYSGNRLMAINSNGIVSQTYAYDHNGSMTFDGRNRMSMEYNHMNLVKKVQKNGSLLVNYSYLADGTKTRAMDAAGNGLLYLGSLIYRKEGNSIGLERAIFDGGMYVALSGNGSALIPQIHITDHLGSVRAIVDSSSGAPLETNNFYPYGKRWDEAASLYDQSNRYRFNGKEEQAEFGIPYIDYGARHYDPAIGRWLSVDPLAEKYSSISPYAFCGNNPVNFVDLDGRIPVPVIGALIGGGVAGVAAIIKGKSATEVFAATVGGAVDGAISVVGFGVGGKFLSGVAGGGLGNLVEQGLNRALGNQEEVDASDIVVNAALGAGLNGLSEAIEQKGKSLIKELINSETTQKALTKEVQQSVRSNGRKASSSSIQKVVDGKTEEMTEAADITLETSLQVFSYSLGFYNDVLVDE